MARNSRKNQTRTGGEVVINCLTMCISEQCWPLYLFGAIIVVVPTCFDHLLRTCRSHGSDAKKQKISMLDYMSENEQAQFLQDVKAQHKGKSSIWTSTKSSKEFDDEKSRFFGLWKRKTPDAELVGFNGLKEYMQDKGNWLLCSSHHNSGRTLFNTVMHTRSTDWMSRCLDDINQEDQTALITAITDQYKPGYTSSEKSKALYKDLKSPDSELSVKLSKLKEFIKDSDVMAKKNNKNFKMLDIIEREITRITPKRTVSIR